MSGGYSIILGWHNIFRHPGNYKDLVETLSIYSGEDRL